MNYDALCAYAGEFLYSPWPSPIEVGRGQLVPPLSVGVYVAVGIDSRVLYVGSVWRPTDEYGVRSRVEEHLRQHARQESWNQVFIVPLKSETPLPEVRRIEGRIGAHLRPTMSNALPKLRAPKRGSTKMD